MYYIAKMIKSQIASSELLLSGKKEYSGEPERNLSKNLYQKISIKKSVSKNHVSKNLLTIRFKEI